MKSPIKHYITYSIIFLEFYFILIFKRIKQNKEKDILEDIKEKSIDEIKKIILYYKTNKAFIRKLQNDVSKIIIKINTTKEKTVMILSNAGGLDDEENVYKFFDNHHPDQIILNNESKPTTNNTITLEKGLNIIEIIYNEPLSTIRMMFFYCQEIEWIDFSNFDFSQVTDAGHLLNTCTNLKNVKCGNGNLSKAIYMSKMFNFC